MVCDGSPANVDMANTFATNKVMSWFAFCGNTGAFVASSGSEGDAGGVTAVRCKVISMLLGDSEH